jgi:hypothetical protein
MTNRLSMMLTGLLCLSGLVMAQDVRYNFDSGTDFSKYHTYEWVTLSSNAHPNQLVDRQIKEAIEAQLAAKGLTPATGTPDIQVGYQIALDKERQWNTWGGGLGWGGMGEATSSTINIGTLGIDFFDPARKLLVWRGEGTKTLDPSGNPQKNQERLQKAIAKILKNFPPPVKK